MITRLSLWLSAIASFTIFVLMLLTVGDIILRKAFGGGITGAIEMSEFMMVVLVFFGLAQAEIRDRNVKIGLVVDRMEKTVQNRFEMVTCLANALMFFLLAAAAVSYAISMRASGEVSMDLQIPKYPFVFIVAAGSGALAFATLTKFLSKLKDGKSKWIL